MNIENIKNRLKPIIYPIINFVPRRRLKNKEFTIICCGVFNLIEK